MIQSPGISVYLTEPISRFQIHFAQQGVVARVGAEGIENGFDVQMGN
jgi:hypothetical protein